MSLAFRIVTLLPKYAFVTVLDVVSESEACSEAYKLAAPAKTLLSVLSTDSAIMLMSDAASTVELSI